MTLDQAREAAKNRWPVKCRGIQFLRIEETGTNYPVRGGETDYVVLKDRCSNSTVRVRPEEVELVGGDVYV